MARRTDHDRAGRGRANPSDIAPSAVLNLSDLPTGFLRRRANGVGFLQLGCSDLGADLGGHGLGAVLVALVREEHDQHHRSDHAHAGRDQRRHVVQHEHLGPCEASGLRHGAGFRNFDQTSQATIPKPQAAKTPWKIGA